MRAPAAPTHHPIALPPPTDDRSARIKGALRHILSRRPFRQAWAPLVRDRVAIFTMHRFAHPDLNVTGHDPALLDACLARLRRERYPLMGLDEVVRRLQEREPLAPGSTVFTVDDGYRDFPEIGAEIFLRYDCPVTVFLPTGFTDGHCWLWWDRIAYIFETTPLKRLTVEVGGETSELDLGSERRAVAAALSARCTALPTAEIDALIDRLGKDAGVAVPGVPPASFSSMTWDDAQRLESRGILFGPHTVTHPCLTRTTAEDSRWQIATSWHRVSEMLASPVRVFSYPNGDNGPREQRIVAELGLNAAVTTRAAYAGGSDFRDSSVRMRMPRFPYPDGVDSLCLTASGFSMFSNQLRKQFGGEAAPV